MLTTAAARFQAMMPDQTVRGRHNKIRHEGYASQAQGDPGGLWYFNPFAWQFLFTFGAWFALGGSAQAMPFIRSRTALVLGIAYLLFALVMTMAARFDELRSLIPPEIYGAFNPNDKTNLAPYRLLHFVVFAFFVVRLLPRDWPGLEWRIFRPAIKCGQQSLEVFCAAYSYPLLHILCWSRFPALSGCRSWSALSVS